MGAAPSNFAVAARPRSDARSAGESSHATAAAVASNARFDHAEQHGDARTAGQKGGLGCSYDSRDG
jgi:hypothetical protein